MTPDDHLLNELLETFGTELESLLTVITDNLEKIERGGSMDDVSHLMEEVSRAGRNIKVSALSLGINDLGTMAEYVEKLFAPSQKVSPEVINLTFRTINGMRELLHHFIEKKPLSTALDELLHQLQYVLIYEEKEESPEEQPPLSEENPVTEAIPLSKPLDNEFIKKIVETFKTELQENLITITDGLLQLEKGTNSEQEFQGVLNEMFRVAHNIKGSARGIGAQDVGEIAHHLETLFTAIQKKSIKVSSELINLCLQSIDYMNEAMQCYSEQRPISFDLKKHLLQLQHYMELPTQDLSSTRELYAKDMEESEKGPHTPTIQAKTSEFESIRVSLQNLDSVSVYTEEIQTIKIAIEEYYSKLSKMNFKIDDLLLSWKKNRAYFKTNTDGISGPIDYLFTTNFVELSDINNSMHLMQRELSLSINELSLLLNALQDEIRTLRLIPVSTQLRYLPRIVRDLAQELNKQVNLEISSNDVKIDKIILDGLKDPIVHLLRNAIDHGIENAEVRKAAGKPPQGNIHIKVNQEDNQIVFKISDDGAGINTNDVIRIALTKEFNYPS